MLLRDWEGSSMHIEVTEPVWGQQCTKGVCCFNRFSLSDLNRPLAVFLLKPSKELGLWPCARSQQEQKFECVSTNVLMAS